MITASSAPDLRLKRDAGSANRCILDDKALIAWLFILCPRRSSNGIIPHVRCSFRCGPQQESPVRDTVSKNIKINCHLHIRLAMVVRASLIMAMLIMSASLWVAHAHTFDLPLTAATGCGSTSAVPSWSLTSENGSVAHPVSCCLPGNVYTHLFEAGVLLEDPLYRFNDINYRWIAYDNWTYTLDLPLQDAIRPFLPWDGNTSVARVALLADGVRVFAEVLLAVVSGPGVPTNTQWTSVANASSQFLLYDWDITHLLADAVTAALTDPLQLWHVHVQLRFASTVLAAIQLNATYPLSPLPVAPPYLEGLPSRNFVRTEQSSFGWDWGPAFAPVGVDGSLKLRITTVPPSSSGDAAAALEVRSVWPQVIHVPTSPGAFALFQVNISFVVHVFTPAGTDGGKICPSWPQVPCSMLVALNVSSPTLQWMNDTGRIVMEGRFHKQQSDGALGLQDSWEATISTVLFVDAPDLWWPRGYGAQATHGVSGTIALLASQSSAVASWVLPPLAIRAVGLYTTGDPQASMPPPNVTFAPPDVQDPPHVSEHAMYFVVNGVPIVAKGSNVIPPSAFPSPADKERLLRDMTSAMEANMNMVRVWGGGYYKADWFYEFCDANGILVWQEFVFACAQYPVNDAFLDLVQREVAEQTQRLGRFGSIVLWSANNENDIYDFGNGSAPYHTLYTETVMNTLVQYDVSRPLWPSSPSQGFLSGVHNDGLPNGDTIVRYVNATPPGHTPRGDTHYYNYFSCPDFEAYPRTHFASEFGFQSLPWLENIAPVSNASLGDWSLNSTFMNHRQHHPNGNMEIAQLVIRNFFNASTNPSHIFTLPFERVIYLSQLQQMLCIADQASFYRRGRDYPSYRTMGSLYWQLNQNWQAPSWTSLEYGGEWKVVHYAMRQVYGDVHLSAFLDNTSHMYAHITNDAFAPLERVVTSVYVVRYGDGAATLLQSPDTAACFSLTTPCTTAMPAAERQQGTFLWNSTVDAVLAAAGNDCSGPDECFVWVNVVRDVGFGLSVPVAPGRPLFLTPLGNVSYSTAGSKPEGRGAQPSSGGDLVVVHVLDVAINEAAVNVSLAPGVSSVVLYVVVRSTAFPLGHFSGNILHLIPCPPAAATCAGSSFVVLTFVNSDGPIGDISSFAASLSVSYL